MNELGRQILSALAAAILLAVFSMTTDYRFGFVVIMAAGVGLGTYFTIPRRKSPEEIELAPGITQADLDHAVSVMDDSIARFEQLKRACRGEDVGRSLEDILDTLKIIRENFKQDPRDLSNAGQFLNEYLGRAHDIVEQYNRLSRHPGSGVIGERLRDFEQTIERIRIGFRDFYNQCLQNDVVDLEVNSETLKSLMDMELPSPLADPAVASERSPSERSDH